LAGRRMNDGMGAWVASQVIKLMIKKGHKINESKVLCLGVTFKENCPDIRNTKAIDVINELKDYGCQVDVYDPWADHDEVKGQYGIELVNSYTHNKYNAIVLNVAHNEFNSTDVTSLKNGDNTVVYDIKAMWDLEKVDGRL